MCGSSTVPGDSELQVRRRARATRFHVLKARAVMAVSSRLRPDAGFLRRAKLVSAELYDYTLPTSRIANRPLGDRSSSRLLVARFSEQADDPVSIEHLSFRDIASVLPARSRLVLNTSRVIPARIPARKESGARAEILLLNPADGSDPGYALQQELGAGPSWKCFIGGRRVREGDSLVFGAAEGECRALVLRREGPSAEVRFASDGGRMSLADALGDVGCTPLPPYIKRDADESDAESYQTVYASSDGSVAAPTAGLHVTEHVLDDLAAVGVEISEVTLHVGAGTFAQLGGPTAGDHDMHGERFSVRTDVLDGLIADAACSRHCIALVRLFRDVSSVNFVQYRAFSLPALRNYGPDCSLASCQAFRRARTNLSGLLSVFQTLAIL